MTSVPWDGVVSEWIDKALATSKGKTRVLDAEAYVMGQLERNRFNTERSIEVYTIAIDNMVWDYLENDPHRRYHYQMYKQTTLGIRAAEKLTAEFKAKTQVEDQRPTRRFLRSLLGA